MDCGVSAASLLRTTLYFALARAKRAVTELEWQLFLRDEVTSRFPAALTVWEAEGQWRTPAGSIYHEQSEVLLFVHPDTTWHGVDTRRYRGVSHDVRAAIRAVGKRARLWRVLGRFAGLALSGCQDLPCAA